ncbi:HAMP domain-containing sensor histidine kinase [Thalassiella azotivora]
MSRRFRGRSLGLRNQVTVSFAAGALALSAVLSGGTYLVARQYLLDQRESAALGQAFADASYVRDGLLTAGRPVADALGTVSPPSDTVVLVQRGGEWYTTSLRPRVEVVPNALQDTVAAGSAGLAWTTVDGVPAVAVGVPVPAAQARFYEVTVTAELQRTLTTLGWVLTAFAVLTTLAGALLGRWASRRVLAPLDDVAGAAARIAGGDLGTRLPGTDDPELVTIVGSFNAMVDALSERIERDARFTADVSHELRSPLTTLTTSVQLLRAREDEMPQRSREVLDLVDTELVRFRSALDNLLELGRLDAGTARDLRAEVDATHLVRGACELSGRDPGLVQGPEAVLPVLVDKQQMARAVVNLLENADLHGDGVTAVTVRGDEGSVLVEVDDAGPGVPEADRERVFERFVRGGSRASRPGTGLGLSLVSETVRAHGGTVWCEPGPAGGARFTIRLPRADVAPPVADLEAPEPRPGPRDLVADPGERTGAGS